MRIVVLVLIGLLAACAQPPKLQYSERVILLPNRDGRASAVVVKRASGEHELATPYEAVELLDGKERRTAFAAAEVQKRYGDVLRAQPPRAMSLLLFFNTSTTALAPRSKAALAEIREKIKSFPAGQVVVIGHGDRVGSVEANDVLSLKRASAVRDMLIELGIHRDIVEVVGRGEREPLVQTADNIADERNRRVEIKLR